MIKKIFTYMKENSNNTRTTENVNNSSSSMDWSSRQQITKETVVLNDIRIIVLNKYIKNIKFKKIIFFIVLMEYTPG